MTAERLLSGNQERGEDLIANGGSDVGGRTLHSLGEERQREDG